MADLLPPNSTKFERNFSASFARISDVECPARLFNLPFKAPVSVLPWLAWEKSVDDWQKDWSEQQKRQMINNSYYIHCHKGTIGALERALDAIGLKITVQEWFNMQPPGNPYTFKVHLEVDQIGINNLEMRDLMKVVHNNKNLRSRLVDTTITVKSNSNVKAVSALCSGHEVDFSFSAGGLYLNGSWTLDGTKKLNGVDL
ncbi:phage tail protein I [Acinetobacter sp. ANC 5659]|uniref:phage tail protein I n=1 Tax=Acinetobacter higginsii TaxID=70347 RepID=UPI001F4B0460|nr:phage tail protein I [Acinetobacter higginsii]MCH7317946.1 phage tail protein I [Acinetobacter higginsii]